MTPKIDLSRFVGTFISVIDYLRKMSRKKRLRLIDHSIIFIASGWLVYVSVASWLRMLQTGELFLPQIHFLYTVVIIVFAMIVCELGIRYGIR